MADRDPVVSPADTPEPIAERLAKAEETLMHLTTTEEWHERGRSAVNLMTNHGRAGLIALLREARAALRV